MQAKLECDELTVSVAGRRLVERLSLEINAGSFVCILGTNGVGKTLTLHTLAGLRRAAAGNIRIGGDDLNELGRREISRRIGLLLQLQSDAFPLTVMDRALMGRYPHLGMWKWADQNDKTIVRQALECFDVADLEQRLITTLSGGERERVALATLMVQDPNVWLLDEPMNHLDPHHQLDVLRTLRAQREKQRIIITTVHNPAMAMRFADQVLLLYGDGEWEFGAASELLEPIRLERLYQMPFDYYQSEKHARRVLLPA